VLASSCDQLGWRLLAEGFQWRVHPGIGRVVVADDGLDFVHDRVIRLGLARLGCEALAQGGHRVGGEWSFGAHGVSSSDENAHHTRRADNA